MTLSQAIRQGLKQTALGLLGAVIAWVSITAVIAVAMTLLHEAAAKLEAGHSQPCSEVLGAGASEEDRAGTCGTVPMGEDTADE